PRPSNSASCSAYVRKPCLNSDDGMRLEALTSIRSSSFVSIRVLTVSNDGGGAENALALDFRAAGYAVDPDGRVGSIREHPAGSRDEGHTSLERDSDSGRNCCVEPATHPASPASF